MFIDEARTPLILSAEHAAANAQEQALRCVTALALASQLTSDRDWRSSDAERGVTLLPAGEERLAAPCLGAAAAVVPAAAVLPPAAFSACAWNCPTPA